MYWLISGIKNSFNFSERAGRKEYWMYVLQWTLFCVVFYILGFVGMMSSSSRTGDYELAYFIPYIIFCLITMVASISIVVRRLHDSGLSGLLYLIAFIPLGQFVILYFMIKSGDAGSNRYGENPVDYYPSKEDKRNKDNSYKNLGHIGGSMEPIGKEKPPKFKLGSKKSKDVVNEDDRDDDFDDDDEDEEDQER